MTNNELKYFSRLRQKKYRDLESKFLIEGEHLITECLRSGNYKSNLRKIFIREDYSNESLLDQIQCSRSGIDITSLTEKSFDLLSDTVNPQGIIGVVSKLNRDFGHTHSVKKLIAAMDSVNDPGNLGTIIRTCYWFGIDELIIGSESVEVFNSKVIRSSQGAMFHMKITENIDLVNELKYFFEKGYNIILADLNSSTYLDEYIIEKENKYMIVFGNEANGIRKQILDDNNYQKIKIRGFSDCESLNLSVSAGIILNIFRGKDLVVSS